MLLLKGNLILYFLFQNIQFIFFCHNFFTIPYIIFNLEIGKQVNRSVTRVASPVLMHYSTGEKKNPP